MVSTELLLLFPPPAATCLLSIHLTWDTERMVLSDIRFGAAKPAGWAVIPNTGHKEKRFQDKLGLELVQADVADFLSAAECWQAEAVVGA